MDVDMATWSDSGVWGENGGVSAMDDPEELGDVLSRASVEHRGRQGRIDSPNFFRLFLPCGTPLFVPLSPQIFGGGDLCGTPFLHFSPFLFSRKALARFRQACTP